MLSPDGILKWRAEFADARDDFAQGHLASFRESISRIAIRAPQIASREPDKNASQPRKRAFPLQAQINLIDVQAIGHGESVNCKRSKVQPVDNI